MAIADHRDGETGTEYENHEVSEYWVRYGRFVDHFYLIDGDWYGRFGDKFPMVPA